MTRRPFRNRRRVAALVLLSALALGGTSLLTAPALAVDHGPDEHAAASAGTAAHESATDGGHHEQPFNWYYGMLWASETAEEGLLFRKPGTPPPFLASLLNSAILLGAIGYLARAPLAAALVARRKEIAGGMDDARGMLEEAAAQLASYEEKLRRVADDVEQVRSELEEAALAERDRRLAETQAKRDRMLGDAKALVEAESAAARDALTAEFSRRALQAAEELLRKQVTMSDDQRIDDELLAALGGHAAALGSGAAVGAAGGRP